MSTVSVATLSRAAVATALTAALAQVTIPLPFTPVPVTLQVLGVLLAALALPPGAAALSQVAYLALGAAGLPVFAGFGAGAHHLAGPTGGYLWGFVLAAPISSALFRMGRSAPGRLPAAARAAVASAAGVAVIYALGVTQLAAVTGLPWMRALALGAGPFVAADLAKAVAACLAAPYVERAVTGAEVRPAPSRGASGRPA
ncbi:biotin transporter BioY [Geochorda subterranea]|uniref:Biotin transporter n=1 Tax=Geochorda subterranea TaxID=3109564 RepID=A0ABZ1BS42_9FIRM|nr:biotin transporter BioY [Limnochorda sp. LNt]WRP15393.1 biotin transporter BioY [Limnochorda sp. LNt]